MHLIDFVTTAGFGAFVMSLVACHWIEEVLDTAAYGHRAALRRASFRIHLGMTIVALIVVGLLVASGASHSVPSAPTTETCK